MVRAKFALATALGMLLTLATAAVALADHGIPWGP